MAPLQRCHDKFQEQFFGGEFVQLAAADPLTKTRACSLDHRACVSAPAVKKRMGISSLDEFGHDIRPQRDDHFTAAFSVQVGEPECFSRRYE